MRFIYSLRRKPYALAILMLLVIGFAATGFWHSRATQRKGSAPGSAEMQQIFQEQLRQGVGTEVRFAPPGSSTEQLLDSVDSVASFIQARSGLPMSKATKNSLLEMERAALQSGNRISTDQLSVALADSLAERMATMSDGDISVVEKTLRPSGEQQLALRADGRYAMPLDAFRSEARGVRDQLAAGDEATANAIRVVVSEVVEERVSTLSGAAAAQFGRASREGFTPLQALLVTYSVIADDNLAHSSNDLKGMSKQSMNRPAPNDRDDLAYGPHGRLFSAPVHMFFNQEVMRGFLGRLTKGGN
jgi:hypothetical protein